MTPYLLFIAGLVVLTLSGDFLVRGGVAIAKHYHVPPLIIGLTIISIGTSAPEFFVSIQAALEGAPGLAVGNAVGSNIANALIVLGLPALVAPLYFTSPGIRRSAVFMVSISVVFALLAADGMLTAYDGMLLLVLMSVYLTYTLVIATRERRNKLDNADEDGQADSKDILKPIALLAVGFVGLAIGAKLIVDSALELASIWGIGETVVGTTIVAFGTTLPEIAATLAASFRRQAGVAIGNVIGSNVFNLLGILGITAIIVPLPVTQQLLEFDIWVLLASSALFLPLVFIRKPMGKIIGAAHTIAYAAYLIFALTS